MSNVWQNFRSEGLPRELVDELRKSYEELKENFYAGKHRPQEIEGGRFAEAAIRVCQFETGGLNGHPYTPLTDQLPPFSKEVDRLRSLPATHHDSLRMRIPRVLHSIYDVRNNRDIAHLTSDVDPNLADSNLVVANADWVLAEFVRLYHDVELDEAQAQVDGIVKRRIPAIEMFKTPQKFSVPILATAIRCFSFSTTSASGAPPLTKLPTG